MLKLVVLIGALIVSSTEGINLEPINNKGIDVSFANSFHRPTHMPDLSLDYSSKPMATSELNDSSAYFSCPTYGPFKVGDPDFEASFTFRIFGPSRKIIERLRIFSPSGSVLHTYRKTERDYIEDSLDTVTFTMPIKDYLTSNGFTFKFEIVNRPNNKVICEYGTTIYPVEETNPTVQELKSGVYETRNFAFYGDGETIRGINERFDFTSISDYLDIDYYYRLNIKDIYFTYQSSLPFSCDAINLRFEDRENLFPYLTHTGYEINVPLKTATTVDKITFKYKNYFYVNKKTLQLSNTSGNGYTLSANFYLPINGKRMFNNKLLYLDVIGVGACKLTASFPIRYVADRSLVGLCGDSGYYVEGGVK